MRRHIQPALLCAFLLGISAVACAQDAAKGAEPARPPHSTQPLRRPKSMAWLPLLVSMMLAGLRSRCTTPWRCALSSAAATCIPIFNRSAS